MLPLYFLVFVNGNGNGEKLEYFSAKLCGVRVEREALQTKNEELTTSAAADKMTLVDLQPLETKRAKHVELAKA